MNFTETEIESIADRLRSNGFDLPEYLDADMIELLAATILDALNVLHE